jgi:hypothetical protein
MKIKLKKKLGKFFVPFSQNLLRLHLLPVYKILKDATVDYSYYRKNED